MNINILVALSSPCSPKPGDENSFDNIRNIQKARREAFEAKQRKSKKLASNFLNFFFVDMLKTVSYL